MSLRLTLGGAATAVALAMPVALRAQEPRPAAPAPAADQPTAMTETRADAVAWAPLQVPGLAPGAQMAVVAGDPAQPAPYTLRLRFPSGYAVPAHWHPATENLTVLSGRFLLGMGERPDRGSAKAYAPGDFISIPPRMAHFARAEGETIVQVHGMGPFQLRLVQPAADSTRP